jgi:hypothetical protein
VASSPLRKTGLRTEKKSKKMDKRLLKKYLRLLVIALFFGGISFFAWGKISNPKVKTASGQDKTAEAITPEFEYDAELLEKFVKVCARLNVNDKNFYLKGRISMTNGADSTENTINETYVISKSGNSFYCLSGKTEIVNSQGVYLFADHRQKKMLISKEKTVTGNVGFPDPSMMIKNLKAEGYQLVAGKEGEKECISIVNDHHITCKLYKLCFRPENLTPTRICLRLSNLDDPADKAKDRVMEIDIQDCGSEVNRSDYDVNRFVRKNKTSWIAAPGYEGYEIVVM